MTHHKPGSKIDDFYYMCQISVLNNNIFVSKTLNIHKAEPESTIYRPNLILIMSLLIAVKGITHLGCFVYKLLAQLFYLHA